MLAGRCAMSVRVTLVVIVFVLVVCFVTAHDDKDKEARVNRRVTTKIPSKFKPMTLPTPSVRKPVIVRPVAMIHQPATDMIIINKTPVYTSSKENEDEDDEEDNSGGLSADEDEEEEEDSEEDDESDEDDEDDASEEESAEVNEETGGKQAHKKRRPKRPRKKMKRALMALLLAYKLKFAALIPTMIGGLVLLVSTTALAGFFFALFAALLGLRGH